MRHLARLLVVGLVFVLTGCPVRSFFPLFTDKDLVVNPALVGAWRTDDGDDTYVFQLAKDKRYEVTIWSNKGDTATYGVMLGKIGRHWYLDSEVSGNEGDHHFVGMHLIHRMRLNGDTLTLAAFEGDWLRDGLKNKSFSIAYLQRDGDVILTAPTETLQSFLLRHGQDDDAFTNPGSLVRVK